METLNKDFMSDNNSDTPVLTSNNRYTAEDNLNNINIVNNYDVLTGRDTTDRYDRFDRFDNNNRIQELIDNPSK